MHECYAMQILENEKKKKNNKTKQNKNKIKEQWSQMVEQ